MISERHESVVGEVVTMVDEAFRPFICSLCRKQKQETNDWFVLFQESNLRNAAGANALKVHPWHRDLAYFEGAAVACGEGCMLKLASRWAETGTFDPPMVRSEPAERSGQ
jgi:hypothetical protein